MSSGGQYGGDWGPDPHGPGQQGWYHGGEQQGGQQHWGGEYPPQQPPGGHDPYQGGGWQQGGPPQQPWPGGGRPPHGGGPPQRKTSKGLLIGLLGGGGVVALILIVVVIVAFTRSGTGGEPGSGSTSAGITKGREAAWTVKSPGSEEEVRPLASFPSKDNTVFVVATQVGVTGYDMTNGKVKWTHKAPEGSQVCASAHEAPDDVLGLSIQVQTSSGADCAGVAAVDVKNGEQLWTAKAEGGSAQNAAVVAVDKVIYLATTHRVFRFDSRQAPSAAPTSVPTPSDDCDVMDLAASSDRVLATVQCEGFDMNSGSATEEATQNLVSLDPTTLEGRWQKAVEVTGAPSGIGGLSTVEMDIASVKPIVLHVMKGVREPGEFRLFDDQGTQTKAVSLEDIGIYVDATSNSRSKDERSALPVRVSGSVLMGRTDPLAQRKYGALVGLNLETGKADWTKQLGNQFGVQVVSGGDPAKLQALALGSYDKPTQLLTVDPAKGAVRTGAAFTMEREILNSDFILAGKTLIAVRKGAQASDGRAWLTAFPM